MDKRHRYERIAEALVERIEMKIARYKQFLAVDGRPVFARPISDADLLLLWQNPSTKLLLLQQASQEGPAGVQQLQQRVMRAELDQPSVLEELRSANPPSEQSG